jgi:malate dehydrogenase (oxaloacetate-decarboxylating)(NADP+)
MYMMAVQGRLLFIGDATVNVYPDARTLAEIAVQTARVARRFGILPRVAMLSFSNFGSSREFRSSRLEDAVSAARELDPNLIIDGPMQADTALNAKIQDQFPFMKFHGPANVLICPNLAAANIAYKLLDHLGEAEMTGPILEGMAKPVQILQQGDGVREVVHMAAICSVEAQRHILERL